MFTESKQCPQTGDKMGKKGLGRDASSPGNVQLTWSFCYFGFFMLHLYNQRSLGSLAAETAPWSWALGP